MHTYSVTRDSKWAQERELECKHLLYVHTRANKQLGRLHGCLQNAKGMLQHSLTVYGDFLYYLFMMSQLRSMHDKSDRPNHDKGLLTTSSL